MFGTDKKKDRATGRDRMDTLIGERTRIEGNLHTSDTTLINGTLKGDIVSDGKLIVGTTGKVEGNIISREILVAGNVRGNLKIGERLTISESGSITGDIETKALVIAEGGIFTGMSRMSGDSSDTGGYTEESWVVPSEFSRREAAAAQEPGRREAAAAAQGPSRREAAVATQEPSRREAAAALELSERETVLEPDTYQQKSGSATEIVQETGSDGDKREKGPAPIQDIA